MGEKIPSWLKDDAARGTYGRWQPLVLLNGLAEQAETWFANLRFWRRFFDVHMPNLFLFEGDALHRRIEEGLPVSVNYLVQHLHEYLEEFVQTPPYNFVASSMGGKVAVEYAVRYPDKVSRLVLICPSGIAEEERLPIGAGLGRPNASAVVASVFYKCPSGLEGLEDYYQRQFANRRWRSGMFHTIRGTMSHSVRGLLSQVRQPTLVVSGAEDRIVSPEETAAAAASLPDGHFLMLPQCGHAPQIEKPWLINLLAVHFLTHPQPSLPAHLTRFLLSHSEAVP